MKPGEKKKKEKESEKEPLAVSYSRLDPLMRKESIYNKVKEELKLSSREKLLRLAETLMYEARERGISPYMGPSFQEQVYMFSHSKLENFVADLTVKLIPKKEPFNVKTYMKNLYRGRQKERAYRSFREH